MKSETHGSARDAGTPWKPPLRLDHLTGYLPDIVDAEDRIVVEAVDAEEGTALVHRANAYEGLVASLRRTADELQAYMDSYSGETDTVGQEVLSHARRTLDSLEDSDDLA